MRADTTPWTGAEYGFICGLGITGAALVLGLHRYELLDVYEVAIAPPFIGALIGWLVLAFVHWTASKSQDPH